MERSSNTFPSTSVVTDHFKFIPFVGSSAEAEYSEEAIQKSDVCGQLSGFEASQFYEEIISIPSTSVTATPKVHVKKVHTIRKRNTISENSRHSIFFHAQNGNIEGIKYFLSENCSIDVQDMYGWTILMCATFEGHCDLVKYLLKKGAKVDIKNKQGLSALDIAVKQKNDALIDLLRKGYVQEECVPKCEAEEVKFCELCNVSYVESVSVHERSIAHLFSTCDGSMSTYYHIPENNKGFQIMLKKGWDKNKGLGPEAKGRKFPIKTILKTDRTCIGSKKEVAKVTHFGANDYDSVKKSIQPTLNLKKERKLKKSERKKLEQKNRALEINFRRQFHME